MELVDFNAEKYDDRSSLLTWRTETEINNDYFAIERSTDGVNFTELGQVEGAGSTTIPQSYEFIDNAPEFGDNAYRLRIVDTDGTFKYSEIRVLRFEFSFEIVAMPNPFF